MRNIFVLLYIAFFPVSSVIASNLSLQPVYSIHDGTVFAINQQSITIKHQNTMDYIYQDIDKTTVTERQNIVEGSIIGYVRNIEDMQVIATNGVTEQIIYQNGKFINDSEHHTE